MNSFEVVTINAQEVDGLVNTVNGRDLHGELEIGKVFAAWMPDMISKFGFEEGVDFVKTESKTGIRKNVIQKDYHLTIDMAKEVAMVQRNHKGREVRKKFIEAEKQLREIKQGRHGVSKQDLQDMLDKTVKPAIDSLVEMNKSLADALVKSIDLKQPKQKIEKSKLKAEIVFPHVKQPEYRGRGRPSHRCQEPEETLLNAKQIADIISEQNGEYVSSHNVTDAMSALGMITKKRSGVRATIKFEPYSKLVGCLKWSPEFINQNLDTIASAM